jgi:acetyltransferase-like isoleucine patch superfamily enzyme
VGIVAVDRYGLEKKMKANDVLASWSSEIEILDIIKNDGKTLQEISITEAKKYVNISGEFGESCSIILNVNDCADGHKTRITRLGTGEKIENVKICITKHGGGVRINVGGNNNRVFIGNFGYAFHTDINIWNNSRVLIGDQTTCNYARIVLDNANVHVGYDSMLSDEIVLQSSDQHGIVDLETMKIINDKQRNIFIGQHVWIGRRAMIMPDCSIGDGSIVAAGSIVTSNVDKCAICVGVPARIVKRNMSWSRGPSGISSAEMAILRSFVGE